MVAGLFHGIEDVAVVDMVPSPATVSYVDSRARYVVDGTVPNGDRSCDVDLNRSSLCFDLPRLVNQRIFNEALCRVVRRARSGSKIEIPDAQSIVVAVQWISHRLPLADKRDSVGSGASDVAARNANPAIVSTHKNAIPAEDCYVDDCFLDQLGGNCIFVSGYNRRIRISRSHIARAGANGISFVGERKAVRNPLDSYDDRLGIGDLDLIPGPRTADYPAECLVEDTLIYQTGQVEKQTAPVEIDIARAITVRHCSIYDVPRAGINIGDGCWGGHHIDHCDVFDTVKETGDHGSFNSWGRDRWWGIKGLDLDTALQGPHAKLPVLDAAETNILSNSRWRCDHGWDIDLDDGSTNYHIYDNLCLNGGLKLREGFYRTCANNVLVNNSLHPHVWYNDSHDIFRGNIVFAPY